MTISRIFLTFLVLLLSGNALADDTPTNQSPANHPPRDMLDKALSYGFSKDQGKALCLPPEGTSRDVVVAGLNGRVDGLDLNDKASLLAIITAIYTSYPCPFSPDRPELRLATRTEVVGDWIFPESSIQLRWGPQSPAWQQSPGMPPIRCEAVSYFDDGVYFNAQARKLDNSAPVPGMMLNGCPRANWMESMHKKSLVTSWSMIRPGHIKIDRTDMPAPYIEEWDMYTVKTPFDMSGVHFAKGDLLGYLRLEKDDSINATTTFFHLQRQHDGAPVTDSSNKLGNIHQSERAPQPQVPQLVNSSTPTGYVPLDQINISQRFNTKTVTAENISSEILKCIPTYPNDLQGVQGLIDGFNKDNINVVTQSKSVNRFIIRGTTTTCLQSSVAKYPIFAAEIIKGTANPVGVSQTIMDGWNAQIVRFIALKGAAKIAYVNPGGSAFISRYWTDPNGFIMKYSDSLQKAGDWESDVYDAKFTGDFTGFALMTKPTSTENQKLPLANDFPDSQQP